MLGFDWLFERLGLTIHVFICLPSPALPADVSSIKIEPEEDLELELALRKARKLKEREEREDAEEAASVNKASANG